MWGLLLTNQKDFTLEMMIVQEKTVSRGEGLDRFFDVVFVRPPGNSYVNCISTNPDRNEIDVTLAKQQHRQYVSILKEAGLEVIELPSLESFPDSVFTYDPALVGLRTCVIGRFGEKSRRGEEQALLSDLSRYRNEVGRIHSVKEPATLEGGDILVTDHGIFVGESTRTNSDGIRQLRDYLSELRVKSIKIDVFHLLCACTYLTNRKMLIAPDLVTPESFPGFEFVLIPKEEAFAAEALYLGEGRVLVPSGFPRTSGKLEAAGFKPIEADLSEFYKGDGGVPCLCLPVYKTL